MASLLIIVPVEKLQKEINVTIRNKKEISGIYVSLNKTHESVEKILKANKTDTNKLYFIDCVSTEEKKDGAVHVHPTQLDLLTTAIISFIKSIKGEKYLFIDALSTLLIYNNTNKVAQFVEELTAYASENKVEIIAVSPKTKGEELLEKIFNFFDKVKRK